MGFVRQIAFMLMLGCTLALAAWAEDFSTDRMQDWVAVDFSNSSLGPLTDEGAVGGSWGTPPVPVGASAVIAVTNSVKGMVFDTVSSTDPITFAADARKSQTKNVYFSLLFPMTDDTIDMDADTKAGIMVALNRNNDPVFFGYTADGWVELSSPNVHPAFDTWIDGVMRLTDGEKNVCYAVKTGDDEFSVLYDKNGESVFKTGGNGASMGRFEFRGQGAFGGMDSVYKSSSLKFWVR